MNNTERGLEVADILEEIDTRMERLTQSEVALRKAGNERAARDCSERIHELIRLRKFIDQ